MESQELIFGESSLTRAILSVDLALVDRPVCDEFALLFGRQREKSADLDRELHFLAIICGWRLRPDHDDNPFDNPWHSFTWEHLTDGQLNVVAGIAVDVEDPELCARMSDIIWLRRRSHVHARIAAKKYVESAERLLARQYLIGEKARLIRAIQLAAQLGRTDDLFSEIIQRITTLTEIQGLHHCSLADLLAVLSSSHGADATRLHNLAVARAEAIAQQERNSLWARRFWELAADFAGQKKDGVSQRTALIEVARTYESEARSAPLQAVAAHFWELALHAYRKVPETDEDRARVHQALVHAQQQIKKEMIPLDAGSHDISELVTIARQRVQRTSIARALAELVLATRWLPKAYLRDRAESTIRSFPMQHMFSSVKFSSTWKVAAKASGSMPDGADIAEERLIAEMCRQYQYHIPFCVHGTIEPMRYEILRSHSIMLQDIAEFIKYSVAVPVGSEALFTVGIHAGVHGRFIEALHVLVPQLEQMLRCALPPTVITSALNNKGIQTEFDLNRLLVMPETEALLGEDLCFTLRVLFTERHGYNLRNEIAHGMKSAHTFFADEAIYAWWLVFRVVAGPIAEFIIRSKEFSHENSSIWV